MGIYNDFVRALPAEGNETRNALGLGQGTVRGPSATCPQFPFGSAPTASPGRHESPGASSAELRSTNSPAPDPSTVLTAEANRPQWAVPTPVRITPVQGKAFNTDVNGLPLSFIISWYEQKAVAVLLTLLALDIKNIRIGPSLPAFLTPNLVRILVDKFNIMPIKTAQEDLKAILG